MTTVTALAAAKLNLYLGVGPPRSDGYHELNTVFTTVSLHDEVRAQAAPALTLQLTGRYAAGLPADDTNLAARAAALLARAAGIAPRVTLTVNKQIPLAAGLAGGSADAAATLLACDELWQLRTPREELLTLAAQLGSDVPFCLHGGVAVGTGRGEALRAVPGPRPFHWVLLPSPDQLTTPAVYGELDRLRVLGGAAAPDVTSGGSSLAAVCDAVAVGDPDRLAAVLRNELAVAALSLQPQLAQTLDAGRAAGALAGAVCGSGPTCAFLAADAWHAAHLAHALVSNDPGWPAPIVVTSGGHGASLVGILS
ncbi:MAG: 4-(cytidine 5'-diphospho)-2-C-methyl-D-erythritol kinase [Mycobacteriales bacterium]